MPGLSNTPPFTPLTNEEKSTFRDAYWASKSSDERRFYVNDPNYIADPGERAKAAMDLGLKGHLIDTQIMVWGWDAPDVMYGRLVEGATWVPNYVQPPLEVLPKVGFPTLPAYDPDHPLAGSIKVSLELSDYPAFDPAPKPAPTAPADHLGAYIDQVNHSNMRFALNASAVPTGAVVTDAATGKDWVLVRYELWGGVNEAYFYLKGTEPKSNA